MSDLGSSIQMLIMPLYILDIGGSAKTIGLFSFLYILPILLIFPFGGVIGDRLNRKMIMVISDVASGLLVLSLAYLSFTNQLNITILFVFQVFVSLFYGFFDPATKGIVPQIVEKKDLSKANSKIASLRIMAGMMSPLIAVTMYTRFGITTLFVMNGISFLISAVSEMFIKYQHQSKGERISTKVILTDLLIGVKFIKNAKLIYSLCMFFFITYAFIHPLFSVVLPLFFRTRLGYPDTYYGYLQMMLFFGALVGSILAGYVSKERMLKHVLITGIVFISIAVIIFATLLQPMVVSYLGNDTYVYFGVFGLCLFLLYASMMLVGIPMQTLIQNETPETYMSRVFSIVSLVSKGGAPLGALVYGLIIDRIEIHSSVIYISFFVMLVSLKYCIKFKKSM